MMAEPCKECEECKDTRKIVSGMKDKLQDHILFATTEHNKHSQDINSLKSTTTNIGSKLETIDLNMKQGFGKQEKWQTDHEKTETAKMEELKTFIDDLLKPIKKQGDKNSTFIYKLTVWATVISAVAGGLYWAHTKGVISFGFAFTTAGG